MDIDPKYKVPAREEIVANAKGIWMVLRASPLYTIAVMAVTLAMGSVPPLVVGATGSLLGNLPRVLSEGPGSPALDSFRSALILLGAAVFLSQVLDPVAQTLQFGMRRRFKAYLESRLMAAVTALPGMAYFEDPKFRDKLEISEWIGWGPSQSVNMLIQIVQQLATITGFAIVAAGYRWWAPAIIVGAALPAGFLAVRTEMIVGLARWRHSEEMRRSDYYRDMTLTLDPAKELRIFGLEGWALKRQAGHYFASMKEAWEKRRKSLMARLGLRIPSVAAMAFAYLSLLRATMRGEVDIGLFASASMALLGLVSMVIAVFNAVSWMRRSNFYLPVAFQILNLAKQDPRLDITGTKEARTLKRSGIEFRNVSFTYPGSERKIIDDLGLTIPAGTSLALVGENGAGKTTLIKLLCRLYDPDEGQILVDGVDVRSLDLDGLRTRLAVIFQDFVHFHLSARDNIGFGAVSRIDDPQVAIDSATRVGVIDKIETLPDKWETPLAKEFGGVDLSGGEWQRVALARAIAAQLGSGADILILDEPTASLDVRVEHDLYEHFERIAAGSTTLLVSHRFSTVRMAQRIVYMEEGRIVEDGSHEELMDLEGRYARMYEMQASHYRETGVLD